MLLGCHRKFDSFIPSLEPFGTLHYVTHFSSDVSRGTLLFGVFPSYDTSSHRGIELIRTSAALASRIGACSYSSQVSAVCSVLGIV